MSNGEDWTTASLSHLADHIMAMHHYYLQRELPLIGQLLNDHVRMYWTKHPELLGAHALFGQVRALVEQHLIKEETTGMPLLKAHDADPSVPLAMFVDSIPDHVAEHATVAGLFGKLRGTLWNYSVPSDIGAEVGFTCSRLAALEGDLKIHIHLEHAILFPRVQAESTHAQASTKP